MESPASRVITKQVHSPGLEGNLLGDSPDRSVSIYLPAAYDQFPDARFPVVYLLHPYLLNSLEFLNYFDLKANFDAFFRRDGVQPMIVAIPDGYNSYLGSFYTNSYVTGYWEDFVTQDLIDFIDSSYRTIPSADSRGIAGHSMGGYGAIKLAAKHPDLYGATYGLSSAPLVLEDVALNTMKSFLLQATAASSISGLAWEVTGLVAQCAAFAPDSTHTPFLCDFPVTTDGVKIDSLWQKWLDHDPYTMVRTSPDIRQNLRQLHGLRFDCGISDSYFLEANRHFSQTLTEENIPHDFLEYSGDHVSGVPGRIKDHMLPFFSDILAGEGIYTAASHPVLPDGFRLSQNYPNPFNPTTAISYTLPRFSEATLTVYDMLGRQVSVLASGTQPAGNYQVSFDAAGLPSGVYFYRLQAGEYAIAKRMMVVR